MPVQTASRVNVAAATTIQTFTRSILAKIQLQRIITEKQNVAAATTIQTFTRRVHAKIQLQRLIAEKQTAAAVALQCWSRVSLAKYKVERERLAEFERIAEVKRQAELKRIAEEERQAELERRRMEEEAKKINLTNAAKFFSRAVKISSLDSKKSMLAWSPLKIMVLAVVMGGAAQFSITPVETSAPVNNGTNDFSINLTKDMAGASPFQNLEEEGFTGTNNDFLDFIQEQQQNFQELIQEHQKNFEGMISTVVPVEDVLPEQKLAENVHEIFRTFVVADEEMDKILPFRDVDEMIKNVENVIDYM
mmetsp:Transcript_35361/g.54297  ORF Transcript_35361/g.54297 Transcript_35361/m.54297 type:complete len:306 (-) Transcript_35361:179-1096(-)|eukprot:CAMPEP_0118721202 /NCGR_PEP_ID=MMETSP0800-20121206/30582_1 /TAXON_ID=210618 ORGANISM="Striatella unipunctata, Strain CCMP2910" /NCGR_SAMPLE_ID=MMETSP0800 /ASSEMBLY_ACC=CAM_ASM_000638 /LENGTH=305 /DNA_ID=CAMNT_0006629021 /DNA_START=87 /DNA_END=1004 /DNA_ORIENTATION=+